MKIPRASVDLGKILTGLLPQLALWPQIGDLARGDLGADDGRRH